MKKPSPLHLEDLPAGPPKGTKLCNLADLPEHGGKEIIFREDRFRVSVLVQQKDSFIKVYDNRCPHAGTPLNMFDENFLNIEGTLLICRTHGALFDHKSGKCILGPCKGEYLREVAVDITETAIFTR
ncbi:Rieske 2Fe-2S domain-containing protein [Kordiimonas sp. SCSIO 12603]|uniref:Rieske (2Fe-2S) protein n=1 Tax=Kordiimonas sp. SCSIO 12603 TaxID=2829596 RepID=UPI002102E950|nr:Rieske 2Fe-2S domain-containing protein [Kordiimonas sp. SCSIO 12603]UTW58906.1 Rieske 2Fe-2S domain-containing protein [Kordiimonas sp. SCSIO 12603]